MSTVPQAASQVQGLRRRLLVRMGIAVCALAATALGVGWMSRTQDVSPAAPARVPTALPLGVQHQRATPESSAAAEAEEALPDVPAVAPSAKADVVPSKAKAEASAPTVPALRASSEGGDSARGSSVTSVEKPPAQKSRPPRGPHLQAGVFIEPSHAEKLKAKLESEGIPAYIESRVHIGPFEDRKEAERMREKLKTRGMTTILISR